MGDSLAGTATGARSSPGSSTSRQAFGWKLLGHALLLVLLTSDLLWLVQRPRVGVADNGDFWRIARPAGILPFSQSPPDGRFVDPWYSTQGPVLLPQGGSTPSVAAWIARSMQVGSERLDIRFVGVTYLVLLGLLVAAALVAGVNVWFVAGVVYLVSDSNYLLLFNSFYAEPAVLLALFGIVVWFERSRRRTVAQRSASTSVLDLSRPASLVLLAAFGGLSKVSYSILPAAVLGTIAALGLRPRKVRERGWCLLLVVLLLVSIAAPTWFLLGPGPHFASVNRYHAVYAGLAKLADDPSLALTELGIPSELHSLPRRDVFDGRIPDDHPVHAALADVSRVDVALGYLRHPEALTRAGAAVVQELSAPRSHQRGTWERSAERRGAASRWWEYGRLRARLWTAYPWLAWVLPVLAILIAAVWVVTRRASWCEPGAFFLALWIASQVPLIVLGDGLVILRQHLIGARFALDLLTLVLVGTLVRSVAQQVSRQWQWRSALR